MMALRQQASEVKGSHKKELSKSLKDQVDLIFEKDSILTNDIIGDIVRDVDNYVEKLLKSIK